MCLFITVNRGYFATPSLWYLVSSLVFALKPLVSFCSALNIQTYTTPHTDIIIIHVHQAYMPIIWAYCIHVVKNIIH